MIKQNSNQGSIQQGFQKVLVIYGLLVSVSSLITALVIFLIPSDSRNSILLGLSLQRFVLIGAAFLPGLLVGIFTVRAYRDEAWAKNLWFKIAGNEKSLKRLIQFAVMVFSAGWFFSFTPAYVFADYKDYYFRLSPLIHWLAFVGAVTLTIGLMEKYGLHWGVLSNLFRAQKKVLIIAFISLTIFVFIWLLIAWTGMGIRIVEDYWYGTGVPILSIQVLIAFVMGMCVFLFEKSSFKIRFPIQPDVLIFIVIWFVAAFLWIREPLPDGFFAPGPYLPDLEYHPYSDAVTFDLGSQFALIGQGINNGIPFDRVLYMVFLVFLHGLAGQNYVDVIAWQTAIYALFPGILYLLGKAIHSRTFGVILAILATLRGINGIAASTLIDLANQKQMLTDFPMAIFVAWFSLMLVNWLKAPGKNYLHLVWAGGAMGLAMMLRTHALFLFAFGILLILVVFRGQRWHGVLVSFLLVLGMLASIFPWGAENSSAFFEIYKSRIQARYPSFLSPATPTPTPQGDNTLPVLGLKSWGQDSTMATSPLTSSHLFSFSKTSASYLVEIPNTNTGVQTISIYTSVATNFFHNLVTSVLVLPTTIVFHDVPFTLQEASPFWEQYWDGEMSVGSGVFLIINLLLISLGIGISWSSAGSSGLVPLGVFLSYNLANAVARTSGGRYIVPSDWIVFFYFSLGLLQVIFWGMALFGSKNDLVGKNLPWHQANHVEWSWEPLKRVQWILITFLLIGSLLPLSEHLFPRRYPVQSQTELLAALDQNGYLNEMGFDRATLDSIAEQWPAFTIVNGRALYPRYFLENKGLPKNQYPYGVAGYPRLGFTMIGPNGVNFVVLPEYEVSYFPNASDIIVLGCSEVDHIDALAVVVLEEEPLIYVRQPSSPLQCPLTQPVCDENRNCN